VTNEGLSSKLKQQVEHHDSAFGRCDGRGGARIEATLRIMVHHRFSFSGWGEVWVGEAGWVRNAVLVQWLTLLLRCPLGTKTLFRFRLGRNINTDDNLGLKYAGSS
jgi:hypothetical protein